MADSGVAALSLPPLTWLERLMSGAGGRLDRFVMEHFLRRSGFAGPLDGEDLRGRLTRALEFYRALHALEGTDEFFATPAPLQVAVKKRSPLVGGDVLDVSYRSEFLPVFPEARNDPMEELAGRSGVARWWRHREPGHPAMICIHGYGGGHLWLESLAFDAPRFYRAGVDVLIYVLPCHGTRALSRARSGDGFFAVDLVRTNEAFARAIYELRGLLAYLRDYGTGPVGAFGMSLGGYTTALLSTVEPELAFAVPMIPLASLPDMMWSEGANDPRLARAEEHGWTREILHDFLRVHAPLARTPLVPPERRLIIAARGDRICPPEQAEALWRHWGSPRIHWYPGGHLAQFRRSVALREVRTLLRDNGLLPRR